MSKKKNKRQLIWKHLKRFPSCACDLSRDVWPQEVTIILRLLEQQKLVIDRFYLEKDDNYGIQWYWSIPKHAPRHRRWYPRQWDGPVMRLLGREVIKPITCAGGYTEMKLTVRAAKVFTAIS